MPSVKSMNDWAVLPYNSQKVETSYLVTNFLGNWTFLKPSEFKQLEQLDLNEQDKVFKKLKKMFPTAKNVVIAFDFEYSIDDVINGTADYSDYE